MRYRLATLTMLLPAALFAPRAQAGPPLVCHTFEIGQAQSLPWAGGPNWHSPDPSYDTKQLVPDTLALLAAKTPVLVRMETLRRAAIYSSKQPALAYELLSKLMARALSADMGQDGAGHNSAGRDSSGRDSAALAWFDAGYLVETYRQAGWEKNPNLAEGLDGYGWTLKALDLSGESADIEFAASLMKMNGAWPNRHFRKALSEAPKGSLLARNLARFDDRK
ncbi:MAG: hypothetical protein WD733_12190 [Bryobacterales bacterium]